LFCVAERVYFVAKRVSKICVAEKISYVAKQVSNVAGKNTSHKLIHPLQSSTLSFLFPLFS
jgi:hypothetical protein